MTKNLDLSLYLVTDSTYHTEESLLYMVEEACKGGVTLVQLREKNTGGRDYLEKQDYILMKQKVQLREKNTGGRDYLEKACKLRAITDRYHIPLIIDDRADVAMACGAAGVHVGASDLPVAEVRRLLGPDKIVGATAKTVEAAKKAYEDGADYLGVGAIYPTTTKVTTVLTAVSTLSDICKAVPIPVVAIGGLNLENMGILTGSGADGIAVVSAIMKAKEPQKAAADLLQAVKQL